MADENGVMVTDDCFGHAMKADHLTEENISHFCCPIRVFDGEKVRIFGEVIYDHQYGIAALERGKSFNKIRSDVRPIWRGNEKWLKQPWWFNELVIGALAGIIARNKGFKCLL